MVVGNIENGTVVKFSILPLAEDYLLPTFYDASAKQIALEAVYVQENC
jgi:hypothetical protein